MNSSKFFAGALVGLVAGLLLAPKKGDELRDEIAGSAREWKKKLSRIGGETKAELSDLRELLADEVNGLSDDVRLRIMTMLEESEAHAGSIKRNIASELGY
jgi:gas vesicle protein